MLVINKQLGCWSEIQPGATKWGLSARKSISGLAGLTSVMLTRLVCAVRGQDAVLGGSLVHFVMVFPSDYPQKAPGVWLYTPVPHPNIVSHLLPTFG